MKKHIGSTIALVFGCLCVASGVAQLQQPAEASPTGSLMLVGFIIILGALAYRSCKKRKLGEVKSSVLRQGLEIVGLIAIVLLVILQNNLKERLALDPFPNIVLPLGVIFAYAFVAWKKLSQPNESQQTLK